MAPQRHFCYNNEKRMNRRSIVHRLTCASLSMIPLGAFAAVFDGGGVNAGIGAAQGIAGLTQKPLRDVVIDILKRVLDFLALAAVVTIIIAGLFLLFSFGEEGARDRAKRIIIYTLIGLVIIFFARALVGFVLFIIQ